ncbi:MCP four helix bundle domain-containing protein [Undibacterium sp. 14-3-2]|uniref:methyl-accepting chemotaxis protein n=1 Tax=Undibacterium sp. 14-3-2 TaxID=2800129 RepID=UPI001908DCC7|nr:methyl-accepting chemotaxis protein [Undibacterium sp. 14-3-2]MBK1888749.1 MCP four helix bundle domain-containing protein [Undibacterium sp. 14-3-2]
MTIAKRLYMLMAAVLISIVMLIGIGISQINKVFETTNYVNVNVVPSLIDLGLVKSGTTQNRLLTWQLLAASDPAKKAELQKKIDEAEAGVFKAFDKYEKEDISNDKDRAMLSDDRKAFEVYRQIRNKAVEIANGAGADEARAYMFSQQADAGKVAKLVDDHLDYNVQIGVSSAEEAKKSQNSAIWMSLTIGAIALAAIGLMGIRLARNISSSLNSAIDIAERVAAGDLTQVIEVKGTDEVAKLMISLKNMSSSLEHICTEIRHSTDSIATASGEIASGNMDLSSRTEQQAGALEETASSMEELTSTVKQNSDNARQANVLASTATTLATEGGNVVGQVVHTMGEINESARKIVDIISVIDGIAFQTNILALNAAVEAARAGEQGRGFAVVASEVRNLAQRSASAAKEIKALIDNSVEKVDAGSRLVDKAGNTMSEIVTGIHKVSDVVSEISSASSEQSAGIEQINQAVVHMDETTQQNAALVEEAAAAASALQDQAEKLTELVSFFKLREMGGASKRSVSKTTQTTAPAPKPVAKASAKPVAIAARPALKTSASTNDSGTDWVEF